jgi:hypothetical protein
MKLLSCIANTCVVALVLFSSPTQAQAYDFSISRYIDVVSDYFSLSESLVSNDVIPQKTAATNTVNDYYSGQWSSTFVAPDEAQENAYASYTILASDRFDISMAVTNYQFVDENLSNKAHEIGLMFDIAAINRHTNIDLRSTYYEFGLKHYINSRLSLASHIGINHSDEVRFYDFAISGEYALTHILSLTIGYANQELDRYTSGNKAYAGARITF